MAITPGLSQLRLQFALVCQQLRDLLGRPSDQRFQFSNALFTAHASMLHCRASPPDLLRYDKGVVVHAAEQRAADDALARKYRIQYRPYFALLALVRAIRRAPRSQPCWLAIEPVA